LSFEGSATRYAVAFLATGIALLARVLLTPLLNGHLPYVTLFAAMAFSAWFCGLGPSFLSLAVATVGALYFLIQPTHSFAIADPQQTLGLGVFLLVSTLMIAFGEINRRKNERTRLVQENLEALNRQQAAELGHAHKHVRDLTTQVLHLQDEERRRLARELHDGVGQLLAALSMNLGSIANDLERLSETANKVADSSALVSDMTRDIRTISYLLHPPLLDEVGLRPALQVYIEGFAERSKISVDLDLSEDFGRLPRDTETAVFRFVQECLTNVHRHSESLVAHVRVTRSDGRVEVEVRDKGKGIPAEKISELTVTGSPGVGLRGMKERLAQLGGNLEINSNGNGTAIVARLPVAATASKSATASA
jgi:signal transduction histidine kinase